MGNNLSIIKEVEAAVDVLVKKLTDIDAVILKISKDTREASQAIREVKTPKGLETKLKQSAQYTEQVNAAIKEQARLEKALITQIERKALATESTNRALIKEKFETEQLNRRVKQAAILSSTLSTEYQKQSVILNQLRAKYKQAALTLGESSVKARELRKEIQRLDARLKRVDANVGQFQRSIGNYSKSMVVAGRAARQMMAAFGFVGGIYFFARAMKDAFNRVREFDKAMQNLAGVMRVPRSELKEIEKTIIDVSAVSIRTSRDVAGLAESLATLGKSKNEIIDLLEPANNLSIGLEAASDEAGTFLVQMLNAFGAGSDEAEHYADVIGAIRTSTTLDFQKMRDSFQYIAPISRLLNEDIEHTGALVGVLADNSIKAEQAGRLLATAQIRLATQGRTLSDGLKEINDLAKTGATDLEVLALAGDIFGKQAAKVGAVLATSTDDIAEYDAKIRAAGGALQDLVDQQLESMDAKIKILDATWEKFILGIENGQGPMSSFFSSMLEYLTESIEAWDYMNRTAKEQGEFLTDTTYRDTYKEIIASYREAGEVNEKLAVGEADRARDKVDFLTAEIAAINKRNEALGGDDSKGRDRFNYLKNVKQLKEYSNQLGYFKAVLDANEEVISQTNDTLDENNDFVAAATAVGRTYQDVLNDIKLERENLLASTKEEAPVILKSIEALEKEKEAWEASGKARKNAMVAVKGSIGYFESLIRSLEDEQKKLANSKEKWDEYATKIHDANLALTNLKITLGEIEEPELDGEGLNTDDLFNSLILGFDSHVIEKLKELNDKTAQKAREFRLILEGMFESDISDIFNTAGLEDTYELFFKLGDEGKTAFETMRDVARENGKEMEFIFSSIGKTASEVFNRIGSVASSFFDAKIQGYEDDINENRDYYAQLLDNENLSEEQRSALEAKRDRKELELEKKKRAEERRKAQVKKATASFETIINTASAITEALPNIPLSVAIGILGAAELATILSTPIPKYAGGKGKYDDYEGYAIWGEDRQEAKITKTGIELSPKTPGNHLTHVKRDDIIHPNAKQLLDSMNDDEIIKDLDRTLIMANVANQITTSDSIIAAKAMVFNQDKQTRELLRGMERYRANIRFNQEINIGSDLKLLDRLNRL